MTSRYQVTLNGVNMANVDSSIVITDVRYEPPQYNIDTYTIANLQGSRLGFKRKERAAVTISFMARAYDIIDRQPAIQKIISWARNGGDLRINDRPGQKLICICDQMPAVESVRNWTDEASITFAAYLIPYWQEVNQTIAVAKEVPVSYGSGTVTAYELSIPGNAPFVYPEFTATMTNDSRADWFSFAEVSESQPNVINGSGIEIDFNDPDNIPYMTQGKEIHLIIGENNIPIIEKRGNYGWDSLMPYVEGRDRITLECGNTYLLNYRAGYSDDSETYSGPTPQFDIEIRARGLWE